LWGIDNEWAMTRVDGAMTRVLIATNDGEIRHFAAIAANLAQAEGKPT
jgi:hypothetical protein